MDAGRCPVCCFPLAATARICAECRWPPTGDDVELGAAQRDRDLRAAHLAARGSEPVLERLLDIVRGPVPTYDTIIESGRTAYGSHGAALNPEAMAAIATLLQALVSGELRSLAFLHVGVDELTLFPAQPDAKGVVRLASQEKTWDWAEVEPRVNDDPAMRRFQLAGGVGGGGEYEPELWWTGRLPRLELRPGSALVLVAESAGWRLLDRFVAEARRRYPASTVLRDPMGARQAFMDGIVRQAPLSKSYDLVLLEPDDAGVNHLVVHPVFGPDANLLTESSVEVYAPVGPRGSVTLPVVVRANGSEPADWTPIALTQVWLPRGRCTQVRIAFDDSANVVFRELPASADLRAWPDLLAAVPRRLERPRLDLVFAVELVEGPGSRQRVQLVRDAVAAISFEAWSAEYVQIGLIGYTQHTSPAPFAAWSVESTSPEAALAAIDRWTLAPNQSDYMAAVEDALAAAAQRPWRDPAEGVLVTVGSRPPYPLTQGIDRARPCPAHLDWHQDMARVAALGVRRLAVWSDPGWAAVQPVDADVVTRTRDAWTALGADAMLSAEATNVDVLLRTIGVGFVSASTPFAYPARRPVGSRPDPWSGM